MIDYLFLFNGWQAGWLTGLVVQGWAARLAISRAQSLCL